MVIKSAPILPNYIGLEEGEEMKERDSKGHITDLDRVNLCDSYNFQSSSLRITLSSEKDLEGKKVIELTG